MDTSNKKQSLKVNAMSRMDNYKLKYLRLLERLDRLGESGGLLTLLVEVKRELARIKNEMHEETQQEAGSLESVQRKVYRQPDKGAVREASRGYCLPELSEEKTMHAQSGVCDSTQEKTV